MTEFLLIVLIGLVLYFAYWKRDTTGSVWDEPKQMIRQYIPVVKKKTTNITTILYRKYKNA